MFPEKRLLNKCCHCSDHSSDVLTYVLSFCFKIKSVNCGLKILVNVFYDVSKICRMAFSLNLQIAPLIILNFARHVRHLEWCHLSVTKFG